MDFQDIGSIRTLISNRFSNWNKLYQELFLTTSIFVGLPTRKLPLDKPWKTDRPLPITLIGDAAQLMSPFAGQGVNIGLMDALILSENLTNEKFESIAAAIFDYEEKMFAYAGAAQLESSQNEIEIRQPDFSFQKFIV